MNSGTAHPSARARLLEAAAALFAEKGFDAVSVREITRRARANLGAVTYHFGGKEALFAEVIANRIAPLRRILAEAAVGTGDPRERLSSLLRASTLHILCDDPTLKAFFVECLQGGKRLPAAAIEGLLERNHVAAQMIREGIAAGLFRPCDPDTAAWMFFASISPYILHQPMIRPDQKRKPYSREFVEQVVSTALSLFFDGLRLHPSPSSLHESR